MLGNPIPNKNHGQRLLGPAVKPKSSPEGHVLPDEERNLVAHTESVNPN